MLQILQNFANFQKIQLDNLVDFEKCCKTRIFLQRSAPIQPKTSDILPKFCQNLATTLRVHYPTGPSCRPPCRGDHVLCGRGRRPGWPPRSSSPRSNPAVCSKRYFLVYIQLVNVLYLPLFSAWTIFSFLFCDTHIPQRFFSTPGGRGICLARGCAGSGTWRRHPVFYSAISCFLASESLRFPLP